MKNHWTPEELADHALAVLKKNADAGKAAQGQKYFKEKVSILGFSAADLRKTARDLYYLIKPTWTLKEVTAFCELMLPNPYLEAKAISIFLLERYIKSMDRNHLLATNQHNPNIEMMNVISK